MKLKSLAILSLSLLAACSTSHTASLSTMQKQDKQLSCTDILLEMNEADFQKKAAMKQRQFGVTDVFTPVGYLSSYRSAGKTADAKAERVSYLQRIYEINGCNADQASTTPSDQYASNEVGVPTQAGYRTQEQNPYLMQGNEMVQDGYSIQPRRSNYRDPYGYHDQASPYQVNEYEYQGMPYRDGYVPIRERFEQRARERGLYYFR